jgi:hypothetical protein
MQQVGVVKQVLRAQIGAVRRGLSEVAAPAASAVQQGGEGRPRQDSSEQQQARHYSNARREGSDGGGRYPARGGMRGGYSNNNYNNYNNNNSNNSGGGRGGSRSVDLVPVENALAASLGASRAQTVLQSLLAEMPAGEAGGNHPHAVKYAAFDLVMRVALGDGSAEQRELMGPKAAVETFVALYETTLNTTEMRQDFFRRFLALGAPESDRGRTHQRFLRNALLRYSSRGVPVLSRMLDDLVLSGRRMQMQQPAGQPRHDGQGAAAHWQQQQQQQGDRVLEENRDFLRSRLAPFLGAAGTYVEPLSAAPAQVLETVRSNELRGAAGVAAAQCDLDLARPGAINTVLYSRVVGLQEPLVVAHMQVMPAVPSSVEQFKAQLADARAPADGEVLLIYGLRRVRAPMMMTNRSVARLIERTVEQARSDMPHLKRVATLSPLPWFASWNGLASDKDIYQVVPREQWEPIWRHVSGADEPGAQQQTQDPFAAFNHSPAELIAELRKDVSWVRDSQLCTMLREPLTRLAKTYASYQRCEVARLHRLNGAVLLDVHWLADKSEEGMRQSFGLLISYEYPDTPNAFTAAQLAELDIARATAKDKGIAQEALTKRTGHSTGNSWKPRAKNNTASAESSSATSSAASSADSSAASGADSSAASSADKSGAPAPAADKPVDA